MNHSNIICVCGAGTMGSGIAQVCAQSGFVTILFDVNEEMIAKSKMKMQESLQALLLKEKITIAEKEEIIKRVIFTSNIKDCKADIIIEAIIEDKNAKVNLFNQLTEVNTPQTIFATNTSSVSINEMAKEIDHPSQLIGMHFFNPAPVMKLVEIIKTENTNSDVVDTIFSFTRQLNKTSVLCNDSPGFIVNRIARHYYLEAMKLMELGLADIKTIDSVMESTGFKMGPFKLMDMIGMDINYSVSKIVWEALDKPERLRPSIVQQQKVTKGELGKKTGKGFYQY